MTPEKKKNNWQRAHDLFWLRFHDRFSLDQISIPLGIESSVLRKMEKNRLPVSTEILSRTRRIVDALWTLGDFI